MICYGRSRRVRSGRGLGGFRGSLAAIAANIKDISDNLWRVGESDPRNPRNHLESELELDETVLTGWRSGRVNVACEAPNNDPLALPDALEVKAADDTAGVIGKPGAETAAVD